MPAVFVDTGYWLASINPRDALHEKAHEVGRKLGAVALVTSDMILAEVLNMYAERGEFLRDAVTRAVQEIVGDARIEVVPQTRQTFPKGIYSVSCAPRPRLEPD
jgi:predicted nucleic acid-binding protein